MMLNKADLELMEALDRHNLEEIEGILKKGEATYYKEIPTALTRALCYGSFEEAELLIKYGCDPHINFDNHLQCAATCGRVVNVIKFINAYGFGEDINGKEFVSEYILPGCIDARNVKLFRYFVEKYDIIVHERNVNYILAYGNKDILEYVIKRQNLKIESNTIRSFMNEFSEGHDEEYNAYLSSLILENY